MLKAVSSAHTNKLSLSHIGKKAQQIKRRRLYVVVIVEPTRIYLCHLLHFRYIISYGRCLCNRGTTIIFCVVFCQTVFLRRLCTDFLETSPHDVDSSAIENFPFT